MPMNFWKIHREGECMISLVIKMHKLNSKGRMEDSDSLEGLGFQGEE